MCRSSLKDVVALDEIRRLMAINAHHKAALNLPEFQHIVFQARLSGKGRETVHDP